MSKPSSSTPTTSFEESLEKLEEIIENMDDEESTIDEILNRYQEGSDLLIQCRRKIAGFHEKVEKISKALEEETPEVSSFEDEN